MTFRIPSGLYEWIKKGANEEDRTLTAQMIELLKEAKKKEELKT